MIADNKFYSIDGRGNNIQHPEWGSERTPRIRSAPNLNSYVDGISQPRTEEHGLPSARRLLLDLFQQVKPRPNSPFSQLLLYFGQFVAHDITRSIESNDMENENLPISCGFKKQQDGAIDIMIPHPIPYGAKGICNAAADSISCPILGNKEDLQIDDIEDQLSEPFTRVQRSVNMNDGTDGMSSNRTSTSINYATSFLDMSNLYGPYFGGHNQTQIRAFKDGKMLLDPIHRLPPKDPHTGEFFLADHESRAAPGLTALVTVFLRYHNLRADHHAHNSNFSLSDEDLYWHARKDTTAAYQHIVEEKYLPTLLNELLDPYTGYKPDVDPSIDSFFSTNSFRYGHSGISGMVRLVDCDLRPLPADPLLLRETHFRPEKYLVSDTIVASVLRGLATEPSKGIDISFVDDVAFFTGQMALKNVQRGRDEGLPSYNDAREWFGFERQSFADLAHGDKFIEEALKSLYNSADDIDAHVGTLLDPDRNLGRASVKEQFTRLRDGDPFWYKARLSETEIAALPSLTEMIKMAFDEEEMAFFPKDSFVVMDEATMAEGNKGLSTDANFMSLLEGSLDISWSFLHSSSLKSTIDMTLKVNEFIDGGYIGIGWGSQLMRDARMWFCEANDVDNIFPSCPEYANSASDIYGSDFTCCVAETKTRAKPTCLDEDQYYRLEIVNSCVSQKESFVTIRSPLCETGRAEKEKCFNINEGEIEFIAAYNPNDLGSHGFSRRTMGSLDLNTGFGASAGSSASNGGLFALHGGMMLIAWLFLAPVAIWIIRYCKGKSWRLTAHIGLVGLTGSMAFSIAPGALVSMEGTSFGTVDGGSAFSSHKIVGLCVVGFLFFMLITGEARLTREISFLVNSPRADRVIHLLHRYGGFCLISLAWYNCYTGLISIEAYESDLVEITWFSTFTTSSKFNFFTLVRKYFFFPWLACICLIFFITEYRQVHEARFKSKKKLESFSKSIFNDEKMSEIRTKVITVESFLELTRQGSPLCIVEGYVIDIGNFMTYHPGGSRVLRGIIGADITQQILGLQDVDGISHSHSPAAFRKLRTLVKAKLETISSDDLRESLRNSMKSRPKVVRRESSLLVFREATITDYTCLTFQDDMKSKPVIRISLSMKMDSLDLFSSLLPSATFVFRGKSTFGSIIERPYTPVNCFINKEKDTHTLELPLFQQGNKAMKSKVTYEFFISLVTNGEMSSYIFNKSVGDHIMVQGPMANFPLLKRIEKIRNKRHDLICIASGTGISPILQLIDYYFENCEDSEAAPGTNKKKQNVFLVWFLMLARNKSSSFKGATQLDAKRKKYGSRFTYTIIYAKKRPVREKLNKAISTGQIITNFHGENAFQRAEFTSRRLHERRRSFFRKKQSVSFSSNSNSSINFLPKSDLFKMQCLYDERKQVDKDFFIQLISVITDHWNEQSFDEIDTSISDEMDPEQGNEVELTSKKKQSTASGTAVAICGSPMFDDKCFGIFEELGFNEENLLLFGPGDLPLIEVDNMLSRNCY